MVQKKCVFKLISDNKDQQSKIKVDMIWKKYMELPDQDVFKRGKPVIKTKAHLVNVIEDLERDNLVMYANEDGTVVLI